MKCLAYLRSLATRDFHRSELAQELEAELRSHSMLNVMLFPSRVATVALGVLGMMGQCCRSPASLEWRPTRSTSACGSSGFAWPSVHNGRKSCVQRWDTQSNYWPLVQQQACSSACSQLECWPSSCIRQLPAIPSYWQALFWPWHCWGCWPRGFQHNAR
jgi:hypothetical protein